MDGKYSNSSNTQFLLFCLFNCNPASARLYQYNEIISFRYTSDILLSLSLSISLTTLLLKYEERGKKRSKKSSSHLQSRRNIENYLVSVVVIVAVFVDYESMTILYT